MSIYASLAAPSDDEHELGCDFYRETSQDYFEISGEVCNCGQPDAPIVYQGSNVLPSLDDRRGGWVDIALIPPHVRYWRESPGAPVASEPDSWTSSPEPFLRFGVGELRGDHGTVLLTVRNVIEVRDTLSAWITAVKHGGYRYVECTCPEGYGEGSARPHLTSCPASETAKKLRAAG